MNCSTFFRSFSVLTLVIGCCSTTMAQRGLKDIPSSDPAIEQASFKLADGFEVNLWAADPLLAKPTQIQFDAKGRLWVASSETYPQLNVNQDPSDKIIILEDTDNNGVADKSIVYYDKLIIPGVVLPADVVPARLPVRVDREARQQPRRVTHHEGHHGLHHSQRPPVARLVPGAHRANLALHALHPAFSSSLGLM